MAAGWPDLFTSSQMIAAPEQRTYGKRRLFMSSVMVTCRRGVSLQLKLEYAHGLSCVDMDDLLIKKLAIDEAKFSICLASGQLHRFPMLPRIDRAEDGYAAAAISIPGLAGGHCQAPAHDGQMVRARNSGAAGKWTIVRTRWRLEGFETLSGKQHASSQGDCDADGHEGGNPRDR